MDKMRLEEIKYREKLATTGPWYRGIGNEYQDVCIVNGPKIAHVYGGFDGQFIAAARQDIPVLIAEIERLQKRIEDLEKEKSGK